MAYRNKTYVCFDGDNDIHYYRLMQAWHQSDHTSFSFYNAHDLNYSRDRGYGICHQVANACGGTRAISSFTGTKEV